MFDTFVLIRIPYLETIMAILRHFRHIPTDMNAYLETIELQLHQRKI